MKFLDKIFQSNHMSKIHFIFHLKKLNITY